MKYSSLSLLLTVFALTSCHKNNNPTPTTKDSTFISPAAADSATGIVVVTYSVPNGGKAEYSLVCLNPDGSQKWKNDQFHGEVLQPPGYANGILYVSTSYFAYIGPVGSSSYYSYGKIYAIDANNGSVKWSYLDSNYTSATPLASNGTVYLPQHGFIQGFNATSGAINLGMSVSDGLPWTPLIDGDTLYMPTAPMSTGYYSMRALNVKTQKAIWTTPIGYNPPGSVMIANGMLVFTKGAGGLVALDKTTGTIKWNVFDQQYYISRVVSGTTLFTFNHDNPFNLYAFGLSTGGLLWKAHFQNPPQPLGGLYLYGKNLYFYAYDNVSMYLQAMDPKTGDSVSRTNIKVSYESLLLVGHRVYAKKWWDDATNRQLAVPKVVMLDAANFELKHSTDIDAAQIISIRVIGRSGTIY